MQHIIGWDVGGAHLKAARVENGIITQAVQVPCPLWLGLGELDRAFTDAEKAIGRTPLDAITMTGESCDAFATREAGVAELAAIMVRLLSPARVLFYAGRSGFVGDSEAADHAIEIASANWHASAVLTAARKGAALFIDMGSTRGSNEDSFCAQLFQPHKIGGAANATRGIKHDIRRAAFNVRETIHVWSHTAADAG